MLVQTKVNGATASVFLNVVDRLHRSVRIDRTSRGTLRCVPRVSRQLLPTVVSCHLGHALPLRGRDGEGERALRASVRRAGGCEHAAEQRDVLSREVLCVRVRVRVGVRVRVRVSVSVRVRVARFSASERRAEGGGMRASEERQGAASKARDQGGGARDAEVWPSPAGMKAASKRCLRSVAVFSTVKL